MDTELLRFLIREIIQEVRDNARVGDQLRNSDGSPESGESEEEEEDEVDEATGAGAIAGMTLPLGMATPGEKKKPGWK
jgi:hypothetical protein